MEPDPYRHARPDPAPPYPEPRGERGARPAAPGPERYVRYETVSVALADVDPAVEVGRFSGAPDAVDLFAEGGGVTFRLTDENGSEESTIVVPSGVPLETRISRRVVMANRTTVATTPTARAVGKWLG